ncbi:MAG: hypothetical protein KFF73_19320 [Cyclobacteriaceae bacterium]|nr:hypothetical protein [Cyclobacteriaceae bacterium]
MNFHISKNGWLIMGTALVIGIAFSIYFLVYVKDREKALIENNFRVLQQIRENIRAQENYYKNAISCNHLPNDRLTPWYQQEGISFIYDHDDSISCDTIGYVEFFNNDLLVRKDVFDYIIVSKYEDEAGSGKKEREILYTNAPGNVADSVFQKENLASFFELSIAANQYVSFNQNIENNIYISGLVNKAAFARQKRGVSLFVIIIFSVLLVFIILNMPLIKMKIMSRTESLNATDVVLSGSSILLGSAVLLILLLSGLIYFVSERSRTHEYLEDLSVQLENRFNSEMSNIIYQLSDIREQFQLNASFHRVAARKNLQLGEQPMRNMFSEAVTPYENEKYDVDGYKMYRNVLSMKDDSPARVFNYYKHFNYIFWCDSSARALVFITPFKNPWYVQDLSHRKYLTNVVNGRQLKFRDINKTEALIGFESIKSVNDGTYEVGIGINSGNSTLPILAMSTKLLSVMNPILPEGYGFCILDDQGNTVFHSSIQKNMNENFIDETMRTFLPALNSQTRQFKSATYGNRIHIIHFRPLTSMSGYFLATFTTEESYNTPYSMALYNSLLLFLAYLIILMILYLVFYYIVYQKNKLLRSGFLFDWLRPFETTPHYFRYRKLFRLNVVTVLYLLISSRIIWYERDILINNLMLTTSVLLICSFYSLYISIPRHIQLTSHLTGTGKGPNYYRLTYISAGAILLLLLVLNRLVIIIDSYSVWTAVTFWKNMVIAILNFGLVYAFIKVSGILRKEKQAAMAVKGTEGEKRNRVPVIYQAYLFTWVIIISILPIHIFFGIAYDIENEILIKYNAARTIQHYTFWDQMIDDEFKNNFNQADFAVFKNSMKEDGYHLPFPGFIKIEKNNSIGDDSFRYKKVLFDSIYSRIRPFYNELAFVSNGYIEDHASDESWHVSRDPNCMNSLVPMCRKMIYYSGDSMAEYEMSGFFDLFRNGWRVILIFLPAALLIYFKLIQFTTNRIYGFKYKKFADALSEKASPAHEQVFDDLCQNPNMNHLFYVSLENLHASLVPRVKDHLRNKACTVCQLDFYNLGEKPVEIHGNEFSFVFNASGDFENIMTEDSPVNGDDRNNIPAFLKKQKKPVIVLIDHFEHEFKDPELNRVKYKILNYLARLPEVKIAIFSAINALTILNFYQESKNTLNSNLGKKTSDQEKQELAKILNALEVEISRWQIFLGKFVEIVVPLRRNVFMSAAGENKDHLLEEELHYGTYLYSQYPVLERYKDKHSTADDLVCMTQQISNPYYYGLWNMLSREEKFLVHDIASNKFVNTRDSNGVFSLLNKGIMIYDHSLRSMNESFSNFVLTRMSNDEEMEKEVESRKKGAWNTTFIILLLVIVSLAVFLSIGQLSFLNDINSLFTSLGALLAIVVRFGGFFSPVPK